MVEPTCWIICTGWPLGATRVLVMRPVRPSKTTRAPFSRPTHSWCSAYKRHVTGDRFAARRWPPVRLGVVTSSSAAAAPPSSAREGLLSVGAVMTHSWLWWLKMSQQRTTPSSPPEKSISKLIASALTPHVAWRNLAVLAYVRASHCRIVKSTEEEKTYFPPMQCSMAVTSPEWRERLMMMDMSEAFITRTKPSEKPPHTAP